MQKSCLQDFVQIDAVFTHPVPHRDAVDAEQSGCLGLVSVLFISFIESILISFR
jgi:hypothetical protein